MLNKTNRAIRNAEMKELNEALRLRAHGNANGTHKNKRDKRVRTRLNKLRQAIRDQFN
jgi:hypothetical protein